MKAGKFVRLLLAVSVVCGCSMSIRTSVAAVQYTIVDLGTLGGDYTLALGINNNGMVVGMSYLNGTTGAYRAFSWTPTTPITSLGTLPSGGNTRAYGINDAGQIVGDSGDTRGFLYNPGTGIVDLGPGITHTYDINNNGQIAGYNNVTHAIRRESNGTVNDLGTLPGGGYSYGWRINDSGQMTGQGSTSTSVAHAYRYTGTGGLVDLGTLGGSQSAAQGINNSGIIAGRAFDANGINHIVMWDASNMIHDLGRLPGNGFSMAYDINNLNAIVGESNGKAFLHTSTGGLVDLNTLVDPSLGWNLQAARAINDNGWIVGWGTKSTTGVNGQAAFLLIPVVPLPASAWSGLTLMAGMAGVAYIKRRRRLANESV